MYDKYKQDILHQKEGDTGEVVKGEVYRNVHGTSLKRNQKKEKVIPMK
ncbi:hypothetical protein J2S09_003941 [Bacillus fengqiuensis]|nr:hypothetical protein [Bacillus fengqiuensis]